MNKNQSLTFKSENKKLNISNCQNEKYTIKNKVTDNFGEIKTSKQFFLKGFFSGLMDCDNELTQVFNEFNFILKQLYKKGKIDIFELNILENFSLKTKDALIKILTKSDFIAVNKGGIWQV